MKIKLTDDVPVAKEQGLVKGRILETIPIPAKYSKKSKAGDWRGVWVNGNIDAVRILPHEFEVVE